MYEIRISDDTLTGLKQQLLTIVENLGARETNEEEQFLKTVPASTQDGGGWVRRAIPIQTGEGKSSPDFVVPAPLQTAQIPTDGELDKDGLPWDERIHSSNKQLTQEGFWRKRRGVTEDLVKGVESELRGVETKEVPPPPVAEPDNPMGPFIAFVGRVMAAIGSKTLTQAQVDTVCQKHNVTSLVALGQRPELVAMVEEELFKS